jgi:hypothetical protein
MAEMICEIRNNVYRKVFKSMNGSARSSPGPDLAYVEGRMHCSKGALLEARRVLRDLDVLTQG